MPAVITESDAVMERRKQALRPHRFKKGVSGNPKGRPKGYSGLQELLLSRLDYITDCIGRKPRNPEGLTWRERLVNSLLRHAEDGHPVAMKEVWERLEGKVRQDVNVTSEQALWAKLQAGRLRLQVVPEPDGGRLIELQPTFDAPAEDAIDTTTDSGLAESVSYDAADPVKRTEDGATSEPTTEQDHNS